MKYLIVVIFFNLLSFGYGFYCIDEWTISNKISPSNQLSSMKERIAGLSFGTISRCRTIYFSIDFSLDYASGKWSIMFDQLSNMDVRNEEIQVNTTIDYAWQGAGEIIIQVYATYVCSKANGCNKQALFNLVDWLVVIDFNSFMRNIGSLQIDKSKDSGKCFSFKANDVIQFHLINFS